MSLSLHCGRKLSCVQIHSRQNCAVHCHFTEHVDNRVTTYVPRLAKLGAPVAENVSNSKRIYFEPVGISHSVIVILNQLVLVTL